MFKNITLKNGLNKFDIGDVIMGRGNTWTVNVVYNDFTYRLVHYYDTTAVLDVINDKGFVAIALTRNVLFEKIKKIKPSLFVVRDF